MDAAGWDALVQLAGNGAQATDAVFDTITKYLTASFPAASTAPGPQASTFAWVTQNRGMRYETRPELTNDRFWPKADIKAECPGP
jgi:hypothetical protein